MKKSFYILIPLILVFVGLSIWQYVALSERQKQETSNFIYKQILLCGKSIEEDCLNFEESVKFEFANRELRYFFHPDPDRLDIHTRLLSVDGEIKRIRRFYSLNQDLISRVRIYNEEYYRSFERSDENYFTVGALTRFDTLQSLKIRPQTFSENNKLYYLQPISNTLGEIVANIRFELNIPSFIAFHFDQYYIGKNSWYWAIDQSGGIIYKKFSEPTHLEHFDPDLQKAFLDQLRQKLSFSTEHRISMEERYNAYSVFYPINIFGKETGIIFSINTDTLWKFQNQTNIFILISFLIVIISIIILFSIVIRDMIAARRRLETTDTLLRAANYASEALLTEPDFNTAMRSFLEVTARTLGYHRAFLYKYQETDTGERYFLKHEWWDQTFLGPLAELPGGSGEGSEASHFSSITRSIKKNQIIKLNDFEFDAAYRQQLAALSFKALLNLPIHVDDALYGIIGFVDCIKTRTWQAYEDAIFTNISHAVEGALAIQFKQDELISAKVVAERANKMKSEFLANVSHEIRTPMNAILGFSEVMLNTTKDPKQKNYLNTILESGRILLSLINDILDLSKIEAGRIDLITGPADLRVIIEDMRQLFHQKISEKNLEFYFEIDEAFPRTIFTDEVRLRQILLNIIGNAVKFTLQGYVLVKVELDRMKDDLIDFTVNVVDTGIGIPEHDFQRIFESFSQQSGHDARKFEGSGLGLTISKRLCELMNGNIGLASSVGKGSRFFLKFTGIGYSDAATEQIGHFSWNECDVTFHGSSVMVVDDILPNRELALTYLSDYNLRLIEAENGEEAVALAKLHHPHLILMDIRMPGLNGYQATELIRMVPEMASVPVIALTASTMQREMEYRPNLFDGFLRKPVQKHLLVGELIRFLPHELREEKTGASTNAPIHGAVTETTILSEEIKSLFMTDFAHAIEKQSVSIGLDELDELISNMEDFAALHHIKELSTICIELAQAADDFDFEKIQKLLQITKTIFQ